MADSLLVEPQPRLARRRGRRKGCRPPPTLSRTGEDSPDGRVPDRVRLWVFLRHGGHCGCCGRGINIGEAWQIDHIVALANGGSTEKATCKPYSQNTTETKRE